MNVFSRIKSRVVALIGRTTAGRSVQDREPVLAALRHMIRFRASTKQSIFGPAMDVPREGHHLSRQTCRHYLRCRFFASISAGNPLMSRRDRRRYARLFAALEYRRQMLDPTNAIPDDEMALYSRLSKVQLEAAA